MPDFHQQYYQNAYQTTLQSRVVSCTQVKDRYEIILDNTVFYPEGGGQPGDCGYLNDVEVFDTHERNNQVIHYTRAEIPAGTVVLCKIDFERRFNFMQNHSGEHLVSGLIHKAYGYDNVGFHMGEVVQIDFNGPMSYADALKIEEKANELITRNLPIMESYPTDEEAAQLPYRSKKELSGQIRLIEIPEADLCACCGTHLKTTGEIGLIKILSCEKHKDGVRIEMVSGKRAYQLIRDVFNENKEISALLSSPVTKTSSYVLNLLEQNKKMSYELTDMKIRYLKEKSASVQPDQKFHLEVLDHFDRNIARKHANDLMNERNIDTVAILNKTDTQIEYIIVSKSLPLREYAKELNAKLSGRGGGQNEIIQGSFQSDAAQAEEVLKETFQ